MSLISRIYDKVMKARIECEYVHIQAEQQAGFRVEKSAIAHVLCDAERTRFRSEWENWNNKYGIQPTKSELNAQNFPHALLIAIKLKNVLLSVSKIM